MINFGQTLKKYRNIHGLTQGQLAERLEVDPTYVSAVENNRKSPSQTFISNFSSILGVPREIIFWESVSVDDSINDDDKETIELAKTIVSKMYSK